MSKTKEEQCSYCRYVACPCFEQGKLAGKKELAKTILNEGYAVADKRYIAVEVERLKSQIKDGEKR